MSGTVRRAIEEAFHEVVGESGGELTEKLRDETVLLESGLDSLGFAILVARLDEELGYDPFSLATEPFYPTTFIEFVRFYEAHQPG